MRERKASDWRRACAVIRAALSNHDVERILRQSGHDREDIAAAYVIAQAEDVVAEAFTRTDDEQRERLAAFEDPRKTGHQ